MRCSRAPKDREHPYDLCVAPVPHALLSPLVSPSHPQPTGRSSITGSLGSVSKLTEIHGRAVLSQRDRASLGVWNNPLGTREKWPRPKRLRPRGQGGAWSGGRERMTCLG